MGFDEKLMPTKADARGIVVDLEPLFTLSADLVGLLPESARDWRGRSTLLQRSFGGLGEAFTSNGTKLSLGR